MAAPPKDLTFAEQGPPTQSALAPGNVWEAGEATLCRGRSQGAAANRQRVQRTEVTGVSVTVMGRGAFSRLGAGARQGCVRRGGRGGLKRGGGGWLGPPLLPGSPRHRRGRSKILAVSLKHWKGRRGGVPGGGLPPLLLRGTAVVIHLWGPGKGMFGWIWVR